MGFALKKEHLPHYTYDDYCKWEGNWELIEGVPYAMSPMPSLDHQNIAGNIYIMLSLQLKKACKNCRVFLPIDWKINENTVVQPDVSVVCKPTPDKNYITFAPALIFEIISPSSIMRDRDLKYELYRNEKVKHYVLVDMKRKLVEIFELKDNEYLKVFETHNETYTVTLDDDCSVNISFAEIWQ